MNEARAIALPSEQVHGLKPIDGGNAGQRYSPGNVGRRSVALFIDGLIVSFVKFPVTLGFQFLLLHFKGKLGWTLGTSLLQIVIGLAIAGTYGGWFLMNKGATPGKQLLGLRVLDVATGGNLSFWKAFGRETFGKLVSSIFFIGFLIAGVRADRKGWHDLMFGSQVLKRERD